MPHPQPYKTGPLQKPSPTFVELRNSRLTSCRLPLLTLVGVSNGVRVHCRAALPTAKMTSSKRTYGTTMYYANEGNCGSHPRHSAIRKRGGVIAYPRPQLRRSTCRARGISESVALTVLCSNCALSPAPQRACRSGRDSQSFSCGGGTPHTRDDSSSQ